MRKDQPGVDDMSRCVGIVTTSEVRHMRRFDLHNLTMDAVIPVYYNYAQ